MLWSAVFIVLILVCVVLISNSTKRRDNETKLMILQQLYKQLSRRLDDVEKKLDAIHTPQTEFATLTQTKNTPEIKVKVQDNESSQKVSEISDHNESKPTLADYFARKNVAHNNFFDQFKSQTSEQKTANQTLSDSALKFASSKAHFSFENFFTQKAMVILGGIFFVLAAFFCIVYSIEHNLITPSIRIGMAMGFGVLLFCVGFGFDSLKCRKNCSNDEDCTNETSNSQIIKLHSLHFVFKPFFKFADKFLPTSSLINRVAQTCIGAFVVVEFFSIYGGYVLYEFFGANLSFALLCLVSFLALFLTIRFGFIVGIFGLLGGFSTPILIDTGAANFYLLCGYLFALHLSIMYVGYNRKDSILPLLSSIFVLGYMVLFITTKTFYPVESLLAFMLCCAVFLSLVFLEGHIFSKNSRHNSAVFIKILFALTSIFTFVVFLYLPPMTIAEFSYSFGFIALLCVISILLPLFARIVNSPLFARIFGDKFKKIPNNESGYTIIFSLFLSIAYLSIFFSQLPVYIFYAFESIFIIGILLNLVFSQQKAFYLFLLLLAGVLYALTECFCGFYVENKCLACAFCVVLCIGIYVYINAKNAHGKNAEILLILNALAFFGVLCLFAEFAPINIRRNDEFYMYLFCALWFLSHFLLFGSEFISRKLQFKLHTLPDTIFIAVAFWLLAFVVFAQSNDFALMNTLVWSDPYFAFKAWKNYVLFVLVSAANAFFLYQFIKRNSDQSLILSSDRFNSFCQITLNILFGFFALFALACLEAFNASLYRFFDTAILVHNDMALYLLFSGLVFGICALIFGKLHAKFGFKALKIAFYLLVVKALWLYVLAFWRALLLFEREFISQMQADLWSIFAWILCALMLAGFVVVFILNQRLHVMKTFTKEVKFVLFAVDFLALILLVFAVILGIHCAFGVSGDIIFDKGRFFYQLRLNTPNEQYAYSAGLVCVSVGLLVLAMWRNIERFKHYCFALLFVVVLKVFFVDTSSFSTFGKIALFVFMGVVFIGVSLVYNKFALKHATK